MANAPIRLLIAASGTGGHLFPAIALAQKLPNYEIEWLGVPNRLETQLVPGQYPLNTIAVEGFQQGFGLSSLRILLKLMGSILEVRRILKQGDFQGLFTTGGYIAGPAVIAARSLGLPVVFHESNALPGKVTRFFGPWCSAVAVGFEVAVKYLPRSKNVCVGTPVRSQFLDAGVDITLDLPIPDGVPLIVVFGGSQGAVAVNQLVRQSAQAWFDAGAYIVHLTGDQDPEVASLQHPQYISLPFYDNMAALLRRANLAISRSGAGSLTELAVCGTPAILIPYPFAAEDHQSYNAAVFANAGAALTFKQSELKPEILQKQVLELLQSPTELAKMGERAKAIASPDSADKLAALVRELVER
ncbi:undecaprenyldiphospho-muramoylpentapeptide beta-N-acetylglucosaminyltransferase [Anabaena cylindrica FACHB-243]|uniref:UDP-N-acetylglucosamine--N-acetylmuramyl-(pentapeptide) pyrophosphoryl-undecaprenol N-acetylglucosamine transferase n=1 Tax=Anabaena cylindrica (strain ATCC 27899 / PCC 7122) TaxID=272123 RepID=K9ZK14_ANACC|nr:MULTISPECIES: undecaprenyldiphospho-muramoylpentapeptide beta-N-acetylglucosaminyltransferase [Anabaena]AFZ59109.1 UDP-N-acetylglucosamine--N-acetylmuramyl-(pentapeptide) pyrophosphoryl-undecaprenol N-acetylglucosamine transferase [Anabaena cylindrica PCC 7122]MBD2419215.1 undecaprenyldiphospho-muramoylpentapeptide beta-N-acetylglucosaminyltransferase [Anabaena cylindrica FACHB-243]MBY5283546.1 undecaprenyldiphospho-muramoylpentapeptide beta-N-acetylglucosaminyltransferase [Anabaena sp. CCAP 